MTGKLLLVLLITALQVRANISDASAFQNVSSIHNGSSVTIEVEDDDDDDDDDELKLVHDLFKYYNKNVRPVEDKSQPVEVKFGIAYTQVVDLNEKDQVLFSNIWVRMIWNNHLLRWNASEYGGIDSINVNPINIWLPDIVLHNNANEKILPGGTLYMFKTRVILNSDGQCKWFAPIILGSGCNIDITYFPFDEQKCELKFGSWTYNGLQVNIVQMLDQADLSFYMESSEFVLVSARAKRNVVTYSCCAAPYPDITFYINIRRKPGFFLYNIIIPCLVITSLAVLTFLLPVEIGERVTLVIESFLALSFIILMVSDSVPVTSDNTPLIVKFLLISMCEIGGALVANCISLNLNKKYPAPEWVRIVFLHYLARCLCMGTKHPTANVTKRNVRSARLLDEIKLSGTKPLGSVVQDDMIPLQPMGHHHEAPGSVRMTEFADGINELAMHQLNEECLEYDRHFWIFTSRVVDRLFLILFVIGFIISSSMIFQKVPKHYDQM